jgi:hypothetical protein
MNTYSKVELRHTSCKGYELYNSEIMRPRSDYEAGKFLMLRACPNRRGKCGKWMKRSKKTVPFPFFSTPKCGSRIERGKRDVRVETA